MLGVSDGDGAVGSVGQHSRAGGVSSLGRKEGGSLLDNCVVGSVGCNGAARRTSNGMRGAGVK
eukprot:10906572-Ditylum_brightwellii.AAC.1